MKLYQKQDAEQTKQLFNTILQINSFKKGVIFFPDMYCANASRQNSKFASVILVKKLKQKINLIKTLQRKMNSSLGEIKWTFRNMQDIIKKGWKILAKINGVAGPNFFTGKAVSDWNF